MYRPDRQAVVRPGSCGPPRDEHGVPVRGLLPVLRYAELAPSLFTPHGHPATTRARAYAG